MSDHNVTSAEAARVCPYCHTSLNPGEPAHTCEVCSAIHHRDCWEEGAGCAVFGCTGHSDPGPGPPVPAETGDGRAAGRTKILVLMGFVLFLAVAVLAAFGVFPPIGKEPDAEVTGKAAKLSASKKPEKSREKAKHKRAVEEARKKAIKRRRLASMRKNLGLTWTSDPGQSWSAVLPQGEDWGRPEDHGNQQTDDLPRYLTTVSGPGRDFIAVNSMPNTDPTTDEENYAVEGQSLPSQRVTTREMERADLIKFSNGPDECAHLHCVKVMLSDGQGGGAIIVAGGSRSPQLVFIVAEELAYLFEPRY